LVDVAEGFRDDATVLLFEDGPLRERLARRGVDYQILETSEELLAVKRSASFTSLLQALPSLFQTVVRLVRIARSYEVVYANSQKALVACALAGFIARRPVIWNLHDILTADHFSVLSRRVAVMCANLFVDCVVVNSEATRESFLASGGRTPTTLIYNGIDATPFEAVFTSEAQALRRILGLAKVPVVGVFSRLAFWKGQHVLLDALPFLPDVHAVFVGEALFPGDRPYAESLRQRARALQVQDRVHFVGFQDNIPLWMRMVDVVVHTSTAPEPFGRVIVEGMLAQRPVVAAAAGGATEIVRNGSGVRVPPGDAHALADVLRWLLASPDEAKRLARVGSRTARRRFSIEKMARGIRSAVDSVLLGSKDRQESTSVRPGALPVRSGAPN